MMYFFKRLLFMVPLLLVISFLAFALVRVAPGGPFDKDRKPASPEIERALRAKYHLDEPLWRQYLRYLGGLARGDFGPSLKYRNHTVNDVITPGNRSCMRTPCSTSPTSKTSRSFGPTFSRPSRPAAGPSAILRKSTARPT